MRWILNALYVELLCWAMPYWLWKVPSARRYRAGIPQRLGLVPRRPPGARRLWVHCASVGEASIPRRLVSQFRDTHRDWEVVFSTFTDTGEERLRALYPDSPVFYWPIDLSFCVDEGLRRVQPSAVLLVELEVWPNFLLGCLERRIPVALVNGRLNRASARLLRGLSRFCPDLWRAVRLCCARSQGDAERFVRAGLPPDRVVAAGSLKYDALPLEVDAGRQERLRRTLGIAPGAPVLVGGSTHPGENEVLLRVYEKLRVGCPGLRLILIPRHIEGAAALARRLETMGSRVARKSELDAGQHSPAGDEVILVDTVGDLIACYSLAACALVGRSLFPPGGGQNMLEPAALGKPVLVGPHTANFQPEMDLLRAKDAVLVVQDEAGLLGTLGELLSDPKAARQWGERARQAVLESRGATARTVERLQALLAETGLA